jgi:hypothetical protein
MMMMDSYLRWMVEWEPQYLEKLLEQPENLEKHLDLVKDQMQEMKKKLLKQGVKDYLLNEYLAATFLPTNRPEPKKKFSREGKKLLNSFLHRDQATTA